jgi:hypothetical protein
MMRNRDRSYAVVCASIALASIALTAPVAESGVVDDWSYARTALDLARTGHLVYNGWAAAMVGAQAYWGALFIRLFGFSFLVLRLSVAPLAAASAALLYVLHRRASLPPGLAIFGALTVVLSPISIPNAASFMTDIPALFLLLVSVYGYVRVAETLDTRRTGAGAAWQRQLWGWLLLGLSAGLLGGTVRQVVWFVPLFGSGLLLLRSWLLHQARIAAVPLAVSGMAALTGMLRCMAWLQDQPYAIREELPFGSLFSHRNTATFLCSLLVRLAQTLGLLLLPLLLALPLLYRARLAGVRGPWLRFSSAVILGLFVWFLAWQGYNQQWFFLHPHASGPGIAAPPHQPWQSPEFVWFPPWIGSMFSIHPFMYGKALAPPDYFPSAIPVSVYLILRILVTVLVCGALALCIASRIWPRNETSAARQSWPHTPVVITLLTVFAAAYIPMLLLHDLSPDSAGLIDRYLLPVLPLATVCFLRTFHRWTGRTRLPLVSWIVLAVFGFYGVAQAHDYFAELRAKLVMTHDLEQRGIPRSSIMAGFEYDGWTQIAVAGHYNDPRIRIPEGIYVPPPETPGFATIYRCWPYTPAVHPDYVVALAPHPDLRITDVPPAGFQCWLPPFHRQFIIQVRDPALAAVSRLQSRDDQGITQ